MRETSFSRSLFFYALRSLDPPLRVGFILNLKVMQVENRIKIGDFVKLTGTTLKTVVYYHKIGLLPAPERSPGGYRLYGPAELNTMRMIKRLKSLGLDLPRIKEIIGDLENPKTLRESLVSLRIDLLNDKKTLEERLTRIESLLDDDAGLLDEPHTSSPSFQMITEIMGSDQIERYAQACPELYDKHRKLYSMVDDFQWREDYQETFRGLAEYFKDHPEHYQLALESGKRLSGLPGLQEDDPQIEMLAREAAALIKHMPQVKALLYSHPATENSSANVLNEMVAGTVTPAQLKYQQLVRKYLETDEAE